MKTVIAGSRTLPIKYDKIFLVAEAVAASGFGHEITEVVSGGCRGIDLAGELWAEANVYRVLPVKRFLPEWENEGKAAGPIRNAKMALYSDALILVWDGKSRGSADMLKKAKERGLKIYEHIVT